MYSGGAAATVDVEVMELEWRQSAQAAAAAIRRAAATAVLDRGLTEPD
jgi:hypothetical protein